MTPCAAPSPLPLPEIATTIFPYRRVTFSRAPETLRTLEMLDCKRAREGFGVTYLFNSQIRGFSRIPPTLALDRA